MPGIDIVGPPEAETIQLWKGTLLLEHCDVLGSIACTGVGAVCTLRDTLVHDRYAAMPCRWCVSGGLACQHDHHPSQSVYALSECRGAAARPYDDDGDGGGDDCVYIPAPLIDWLSCCTLN